MKRFILIAILLSSIQISAQSNIESLVTDRPDQTESSSTVPVGYLQVETGIIYDNLEIGSTTVTSLGIATTLLRLGITDNFELRAASEFLNQTLKAGNTETTESGMGGLDVGTKIYFFEETYYMPEAALIANFNLPVGADAFVGDKITPSVILAMSNTISKNVGFGYNLGVEFAEESQNIFFVSAALGIGLTDKLSCFIESYNFLSDDSNPQLFADAGFTYLINNDFQLDASAGYGLNDEYTSWFINGGFSYRLKVLK
ncbi:transporter [Bacteroidota bacterium]